jgi:Ca-activated chloride channel family protein
MLVVDVSRSMAERDFPAGLSFISRLDGLKSVVSEYVKNRTQDRVGLVVFGQAAFLQSPLTSDTSLVEQFVKTLWPRMAGDGTAIGDGLGLALKRLRKTTQGSRAIILMTDGVNTAGQVSPLKAAQVAKDLAVQIHTIGIGGGAANAVASGLGDLFNVGGSRHSEFDDDTLKKIASLTGGVYFNASSLSDFKAVYQELEKLTTTESKQPAQREVEELFFPWALAGLITFMAVALLNATVFMRVP